MSIYNCSPGCHCSYSLYLYPVPLSLDSQWLMVLIYIWTQSPLSRLSLSSHLRSKARWLRLGTTATRWLLDPFSSRCQHRGLHRVQKGTGCTETHRDQSCEQTQRSTGAGRAPASASGERSLNLPAKLPQNCPSLLLFNEYYGGGKKKRVGQNKKYIVGHVKCQGNKVLPWLHSSTAHLSSPRASSPVWGSRGRLASSSRRGARQRTPEAPLFPGELPEGPWTRGFQKLVLIQSPAGPGPTVPLRVAAASPYWGPAGLGWNNKIWVFWKYTATF